MSVIANVPFEDRARRKKSTVALAGAVLMFPLKPSAVIRNPRLLIADRSGEAPAFISKAAFIADRIVHESGAVAMLRRRLLFRDVRRPSEVVRISGFLFRQKRWVESLLREGRVREVCRKPARSRWKPDQTNVEIFPVLLKSAGRENLRKQLKRFKKNFY